MVLSTSSCAYHSWLQKPCSTSPMEVVRKHWILGEIILVTLEMGHAQEAMVQSQKPLGIDHEPQSHRAMQVSKSGGFWSFQNVGQVLEKTHNGFAPFGPLVSDKKKGNVKHFVARLSDKPHHPQHTSSDTNASLTCVFQYEGCCSRTAACGSPVKAASDHTSVIALKNSLHLHCYSWRRLTDASFLLANAPRTCSVRSISWETIYGQRLACCIDTGWRQTNVGIPFHSTCAFHLASVDSMIFCN